MKINKDILRKRVLVLLWEANPINIEDDKENIFGLRYNFSPRDLVYVSLQLEKEFNIDLNILVQNLNNVSVNDLVQVTYNIINDKYIKS